MFVTSVVQFWSEWGLRICVLGSLAAYTILSLLSGTRQRSASGRRSTRLQWAVVLILWAAYQAAELAATAALGSLSLSRSDVSADEHQLIAFWAPFLLLHLGGPDNMTAYTLEDNMLSRRKAVEMILQLLGVMYAIWNYIYRSHSLVLLAASVIMLVVGGARYVERAWALWRANLDNMQDSIKRKERANLDNMQDSVKRKEPAGSGVSRSRSSSTSTEVIAESAISRSLGRDLDDDEALLLAQDLFHIWRHALVDSSVDPRSPSHSSSEKILSLRWRTMCKVVEMELSLMYEVLYTKASLAHTYRAGTCYLIIRFMSPPASAAAGWLFWLYSNKKGRQLRGSFVIITYLLLGAAFTMDVVWLLRALGSTWTYYLLKKKAWRWPWAWFQRQVLWAGLWLHRAVIYLDPLRLVFGINPVRNRRWSGTIGRYNLLHECTVRRRPWRLWLATKAGLEETRYLSELPEGVKELLFERVLQILPRTANKWTCPNSAAYTMMDITTCWGQEALRRGKKLFGDNELPISGREFEQDVIAWHIATCIFLSRDWVRKLAAAGPSPTAAASQVVAIETMSEYMMFLVAKRRQMLPGLVLHSLLEETRRVLEMIWEDYQKEAAGKGKGTTSSRDTSPTAAGGNEEKLPTLLRQKRNVLYPKWADYYGNGSRLVFDAAAIARALTKSSMSQQKVAQMLQLVFNVWVDKLLYAGIRCSRESHAKQLSCGGDLTTVLWMVIQHAGPFRIGEEKPKEKKLEEKRFPDNEWLCPKCYCLEPSAEEPLQEEPEEARLSEMLEKPQGKKLKEKKKPEEKKCAKSPFDMIVSQSLSKQPTFPLKSTESVKYDSQANRPPYHPQHYPRPCQMPIMQPMPMPMPVQEEPEVDPEDAKDYETPIEYITLY